MRHDLLQSYIATPIRIDMVKYSLYSSPHIVVLILPEFRIMPYIKLGLELG